MMPKEELAGYPFNAAALRAVCANYADGLVEAIEAVSLDFDPSDAHKRAVCNLMDNSLRKTKRHALYRRVGTIAAVFVLLFGTVMVTNAHARELFVRWVKQIFPDRVIYQFYGDPMEGLNNYRIGWIPEGFELVDEDESDTSAYYVYESETGESFVFYYEQTDPIDFTEYVPLGDYSHETVQILDKSADLYSDKSIDGNLTVIWVDDENHCILCFDAIMQRDKLLKIAESIYIAKPRYAVGWIPEGFELVDDYYDEGYGNLYYLNDDRMIVYEYSTLSEMNAIDIIDTDTCEPVIVNDRVFEYYQDPSGGSNIMVWVDEAQAMVHLLNADLSKSEMVEVMQSIYPLH